MKNQEPIHSLVESIVICIKIDSGRCDNMQASHLQKNQIIDIILCFRQGVMGLSVAFDLPTQLGYDSDNHLAAGEVGKVGVPISSIENMRILFDNIPLEKISTSMTINATAPILLAFYISTAENQGVPLKS